MKREYHQFMSEDSGEQSPHKFSRVPDIKTARQNLSTRRDEKQIGLMQEALIRNAQPKLEAPVQPRVNIEEPSGSDSRFEPTATTKEVSGVERDPVKVRAELFKVLSEIAIQGITPKDAIHRQKIAQLINEKIGHLLYDELVLESLTIPSVGRLKALESNPNYDPQSIRVLMESPQLRRDYNPLLRGYSATLPRATIGEFQKRVHGKNMHATFVKTAFMPRGQSFEIT